MLGLKLLVLSSDLTVGFHVLNMTRIFLSNLVVPYSNLNVFTGTNKIYY